MNQTPAGSASLGLEVVHAQVPGRARLRLRGLYRDEAACQRVRQALEASETIRLESISSLTGTLLVRYPPGQPIERLLHGLAELLAGLIEAHAAPEPNSLRRLANPRLPPRKLSQTANAPARAEAPRSSNPALPAAARSASRWHVMSPAEVLAQQQVDIGRGLDAAQVAERRARFGPNVLPQAQRRSALAIFLSQFDSLPVMLLGASALLSAATGGLADAAVILGVVLINAGIGYATESQAERIIDTLTAAPRPPVPVLREGQVVQVAAAEVVPGDVVLLTPGCVVPADARLVHARELRVDESALTGESLPVAKATQALSTEALPLAERNNMVYMGTAVTGGSAVAVVVATGAATELGLIQALVGETRPP